jgi:AcrR family transcriptional regulator
MLAAAAAMVSRSGLTVGLDHISFEEVIRHAGVSRSAAYRRWSHKDLFFSDLVTRLARDATPALIADETVLWQRILSELAQWISTPRLRARLFSELMRQVIELEYEAVITAPPWRTYIALHATSASIADEALRERVRAVLADSDQAVIAKIAASWEGLAGLFGFRLRPELATAGFETLAATLSPTLRGFQIAALATPELTTRRVHVAPVPDTPPADWTLPAIAIIGIAQTFLEPDPAITWDDERIANVQQGLASLRPADNP